jgi:hypothetical protein
MHYSEIASPPEKRQMLMVNSAILHLREKLSAGEVSVHVVQKLSQLVSDLASRNFQGAGAVQTVRTCVSASHSHHVWVCVYQCVCVFTSVCVCVCVCVCVLWVFMCVYECVCMSV